MASNLRKFVNLKFLNTCDLTLMRRLMSRYATDAASIDLTVFDSDAGTARDALRKFFQGPENAYPQALTADLHRVADLGTQHGMRLLLERAKAAEIAMEPAPQSEDAEKVDAKYVALRAFLDYRAVFDAASDLLALETTVGLTELNGEVGDTRAVLDDETKAAFEAAAGKLFASDMMGRYCRIGWYEDGDEIRVIIVHGTEIASEWVVENGNEKVISFRPLGTAVLSYDPVEGRLKVGGLSKAQRGPLANLFAATMLKRPTFFNRDDARELYTLAPVEKAGATFLFDHQFDPGIRSVRVIEAQADRMAPAKTGKRQNRQWSVLVKDRNNALQRMGQVAPTVSFGPNAYQLAHIGFRVEFDSETKPHPRVTVKLTPPETAAFKREMFEGRIMTLLQRNGLCLDRDSGKLAVAAE